MWRLVFIISFVSLFLITGFAQSKDLFSGSSRSKITIFINSQSSPFVATKSMTDKQPVYLHRDKFELEAFFVFDESLGRDVFVVKRRDLSFTSGLNNTGFNVQNLVYNGVDVTSNFPNQKQVGVEPNAAVGVVLDPDGK